MSLKNHFRRLRRKARRIVGRRKKSVRDVQAPLFPAPLHSSTESILRPIHGLETQTTLESSESADTALTKKSSQEVLPPVFPAPVPSTTERSASVPIPKLEIQMALGSRESPTAPTKPRGIKLDELPLDLLLEIDRFLGDEDSLVFRATTKALRSIPPKAPEMLIGVGSMLQMCRRLQWDKICRHFATETPESPLQVCALCSDVHPKDWFSASEVAQKDAWNRCCLRQRVYRVCEHLALNYFEMRSMPNYGTGIFCEVCTARPLSPSHGHRVADGYGRNLTRMGDWYVQICRSRVPDVQSRVSLPIERVHDRLARLATPICPHVRFCDIDLERRVSAPATLHFEKYALGKVEGCCKVPHCSAVFSFRWEREMTLNFDYDFIMQFRSKHEFKLEGPEGKGWLAVSEMPSKKGELLSERLSQAQYRKWYLIQPEY